MKPKLIHYCWFGDKSVPENALKCLESWKKYLPDHDIILWNESNSPMLHPYVNKAYKNKNLANVSNFIRLYALFNYGGWYFDSDVEVLNFFDFNKFKEGCILGIESDWWEKDVIVNNAIIYSNPKHEFISNCLQRFEDEFDGLELANISSPILTTEELVKIGFKGKPGVFNDVRVLKKDIFYPSSYFDISPLERISKDSFSIHFNDSTWVDFSKLSKNEILRLHKLSKYNQKHLNRFKQGKITHWEWLKITYNFLFKR